MKNFIATVTVIGAFALAPAALAQPDQHKPDEHKGGGPAQGAKPGGGPAGHAPERSPGGPGGPGGGGHGGGPAERAPSHEAAPPNAGHGGSRQGAPEHARSEPTGGRIANAPNPGARNVQPTGRTPNAGAARRSPNVAALRGNVQSSRRFQAGAYRPPQGYQPRHWSYGDRLPSAYFARNYWLTNFLIYGLLAPPPGLVWVRVGPDALLIDQYSGEIVRVQYGVFY